MDVGEVQSIRFAISISVFFRKVWSSQEWEGHMQKPERKQEIATLEEIWWCKFVCGSEIGLGSLGITSVNSVFGSMLSVSSHRREMRGYFDNIFYLLFAPKGLVLFCWATSSSRNRGWGDDDFLPPISSHSSLHTMEYILGFGGQLADLLTQLIQEMKKEELLGDYTEDHVTYELSQLCAQVYLYKGYFTGPLQVPVGESSSLFADGT